MATTTTTTSSALMWQWLSSADGFWHLYDPHSQKILTAAKENNAPSVVVFIDGQCTVANLKAMIHVESSTGFSCKIRLLQVANPHKLPVSYGRAPTRYDGFVNGPSAFIDAQPKAPVLRKDSTITLPSTVATTVSTSSLPSIPEPGRAGDSTNQALMVLRLSPENLNEVPLVPAIVQMNDWLTGLDPIIGEDEL